MRRASPFQSLAASPTMVGAVTTLIVIVAVFLAYNANNGLPFVPVYRVSVEVPSGARLIRNNEVRIGGHRIGVVESIEPTRVSPDQTGSTGTNTQQSPSANQTCCLVAKLNLKLDQAAGPLPQDSVFRVRYRSSFGLKYLDITRGVGPDAPEGFVFNGLDDNGICQLPTNPGTFASTQPSTAKDGCFQNQTEFDAISNTFNTKTRTNARINLVGFGDAFAGRGASLNDAIAALRPLFANLKPVSKILSDPNTQLRRFIQALANTARIVAPVAVQQADFFTQAAIAFQAISSDPAALRATISEGRPLLEQGVGQLRRQRPFLSEFALLSRRLRPGVRQLRIAIPTLNDAITIGTPVLNRSVKLNHRLRQVLVELRTLVQQPSTLNSLKRLKDTFSVAQPLAKYVAPSQTVCNYFNYWFTILPNGLSDRDQIGGSFRQSGVGVPTGSSQLDIGVPVTIPGQVQTGLGGYSGLQANGIAGGANPPGEPGKFEPWKYPILHGNPYGPTGQKNADCQGGQVGYLLGDLRVPGQSISNPSVGVSDMPGSRGPTTLFYNQDSSRVLRDTRIPSHQP